MLLSFYPFTNAFMNSIVCGRSFDLNGIRTAGVNRFVILECNWTDVMTVSLAKKRLHAELEVQVG